MIKKKKCENIKCNKEFYGTKRARFCCDKCRVTKWREKDAVKKMREAVK
jgi:hypothetical protein